MWRVRLGLFAAGLATFALLYSVQPVLPMLAKSFRISPAGSSLAMSGATGALAVAVIPVSSLSEVFGRRRVMVLSLLLAVVLGILAPLSPTFEGLVVVRVLQGIALAGLPAVAMAYLAEEVDAGSLSRAMGLYIAGNAIGGLTGRMVVGALADAGGWRLALLGVGGFALLCGVVFAVVLPRSSFFTPVPFRLGQLASSLRVNLADTALLRLYLAAFTLTGALVTVYNYLTFRLTSAPFRLPATVVGAIFVVYLAGTVSSAGAGRLVGRFGRSGRSGILVGGFVITMSGALLTLPTSLVAIVSGLVVLTSGFFAAHSVASGWVGARARVAPAQASALYLCAFYVGSSVVGSAGGVFYARGGWPLTVVLVVVLLAAGLAAAMTMRVTRLRHDRNDAPGRDRPVLTPSGQCRR